VNPFDLSASDLLIWGLVAHLIADWPLQTGWMVAHKSKRHIPKMRRGDGRMTPPRIYQPPTKWWWRHAAAYVHAGVHLVMLSLVFGPIAGVVLALLHLIIDTRVPVLWWTRTFGQTQPWGHTVEVEPKDLSYTEQVLSTFTALKPSGVKVPLYDIGTEVQLWIDQVFHIVCIAVMALLVTL
jgi:hypothetical protein